MRTRVQKWGNSLGVRIPRGLAEQIGLGAGTEVSLSQGWRFDREAGTPHAPQP